jgi:site-specific recombinase XerD
VIALLDEINDRCTPIQANRTLASVRKMFSFGLQRDTVSANPCAAIKSPGRENRCDRMLSPGEIRPSCAGLTMHPWRQGRARPKTPACDGAAQRQNRLDALRGHFR